MKEKKIPAGKLTNLEEVDGWVSLADLLKEFLKCVQEKKKKEFGKFLYWKFLFN